MTTAEQASQADQVAGSSLAVAGWTVASRVTGFARVAVIAAVLGPTYLGNTFLALNQLPNIVWMLLVGSLFPGLLVPALVKYVDGGDREAVNRIAGGFLSFVLVSFSAVTLLVIATGPLLLDLLSVGVADRAVAEEQQRVGMVLMVMLMPQVVFYGVVAVSSAVMNAHGRFALAAGAPVVENLGIIATLGAVAVIYGTGGSLESVDTPQLLLLGLGTTGSVALHAATQWWGALRVGVLLTPRTGWREPEVLAMIRRAALSLGYTGLIALRYLAALVVANTVQGGVVAFTLALNFFSLPGAIGTEPVARAFLPVLSRLYHQRALARFRDEFVKNTQLAIFVAIPAATAFLVLALPLARAASYGEMAGSNGVDLLAVSLAALSAGVVGEAVFWVATHAAYALHDARSPFVAMAFKAGVSVLLMTIGFLVSPGEAVLAVLGAAITIGDIAGALVLGRALRSALPRGEARLLPGVRRTMGASLAMVVPAYFVALGVPSLVGGELGYLLAALLAAAVGAVVFLAVQRALRSPELDFFLGGFRHIRREGIRGASVNAAGS
jgi:putative peptidoglycan lipid II flippase